MLGRPEGTKTQRAYVRIERQQGMTPAALALIAEYYAAAAIVARESPATLAAMANDPAWGFWIAFLAGDAAGCVMLWQGVCKRLYVRPAFRGGGVAQALMAECEQSARATGLAWIHLDTDSRTMAAAVKLYARLGYEPCARFNDNPQADTFLRKRL